MKRSNMKRVAMASVFATTLCASMMMGMPVAEIDDMAKSALSELGNMIMGNAATLLSNSNLIIIYIRIICSQLRIARITR